MTWWKRCTGWSRPEPVLADVPAAAAAVDEPEWLARSESADALTIKLRVPANLRHFQGHFPDFPILPGVAQLHWAVRAAQQQFGYGTAPTALQAVKFHQVVIPEQVLNLQLTHNRSRQSVSSVSYTHLTLPTTPYV